MEAKKKLIVALDVPKMEDALELVDKLDSQVEFFKVGMELFTAEGPKVVRHIVQKCKKVFLDLKFHDIPNTVAQAGERATALGVSIFNVHTAGGLEMMKKTKEKALETAEMMGLPCPLVIGVTVLTSMNQETLNNQVGIPQKVEEQVVKWALLAKEAGLDGVVASPKEVELVKKACGKDFYLVTPGIRPSWAQVNDQKRIMTPGEAMQIGSDFIVVGRPITGDKNPQEAARKIIEEMEGV